MMNTVTAETKYVAALKYSARSTLLVLKYGVTADQGLADQGQHAEQAGR